MTSTVHESMSARRGRPRQRQRQVTVLSRAEGRLLLRHPIFLVGAALSGFLLAIDTDVTAEGGDNSALSHSLGGAYFNLTGSALLWLALATLLSANLAALRSRRDRTGETYRSFPAEARARTAAHLLAVLWAVGIAVAFVAGDFFYHHAGRGLIVDYSDRRVVPSPFELAQGPLVVLVFGILGVALAVWLPRLTVTLMVTFVIFASEQVFVQLTSRPVGHSSLRWLFPFANSATYTRPGAEFPPQYLRYDGLAGFDVTAAGWHLLYLAALAISLAALALLRHSPRKRLLGAVGVILVVLVAAALPQLWT